MSSPLKVFEEEITKLRNSLSHIERRLGKLQDHPFKTANDLINDYLDKKVVIRLRSGQEIAGVYKRYDKYHVLLDVDGAQTLVFKHAIESLREQKG